MRQRFYEVLKYPLEQIRICPNSFSNHVTSSHVWPVELESFSGKFILLALTRYYPHKNLEKLLEVYLKCPEDLQDTVCVLPIARDQGPHAVAFIDRVEKEGLQEQVVCIGAIPQEKLGGFFYAADVMILPTLLESFSGTYLESMQLEVPILTSDLDFAREICGPAAEYIDPYSTESIKNGIVRLRNDTKRRAELVAFGRERMEKYMKTWPEILRAILSQEGVDCG